MFNGLRIAQSDAGITMVIQFGTYCGELIGTKRLNYPSIGQRHPQACCLPDSQAIRPAE